MENVIFGGSGPTGKAVARYLVSKGHKCACVSRSGNVPKELEDLKEGVIGVKGDALDAGRCQDICKSAKRVFFCLGLEYSSSVWSRDFPVALDNVLSAVPQDAVFVMADNLYMFGAEQAGKVLSPTLPFTTIGVKPKLRGEMNRTIQKYHDEGRCKTVIMRAADFYGPEVTNSALGEHVFAKIRDDSAPAVVQPMEHRHAFTFVPDQAEAMVEASMEPKAWGKALHCPCAEARVYRHVIQDIANEYQKPDLGKSPQQLVGWTRGMLGMFIGPLAEMQEMQYQWDQDFLVDHSDYLALFPKSALPTPMDKGITATVAWYQTNKPDKKGWFG